MGFSFNLPGVSLNKGQEYFETGSEYVTQGLKTSVPFATQCLAHISESYIHCAHIDKSTIEDKLNGVWAKLKSCTVDPEDDFAVAVGKLAKNFFIALPLSFIIWKVGQFTKSEEAATAPIWHRYGSDILFLFSLQFVIEALYAGMYPDEDESPQKEPPKLLESTPTHPTKGTLYPKLPPAEISKSCKSQGASANPQLYPVFVVVPVKA